MYKLFIILFCFAIFSSCDNNRPEDKPLLIAAASNVQFVLEELVQAFEDSTGIHCDIVMSSSGKLASQISAGASYDVFISADQYYPSYLKTSGFSDSEPFTYAHGSLIVWSTKHVIDSDSFDFLGSNNSKIAIANPKIAPYGKAALEVFEYLGIAEEIEPRLVYGENISQVNQFITVGAADVGITSQSVVFSGDRTKLGSWYEVPDSLYNPILQDAVGLKGGSATKVSKDKFLTFLRGARAKSILKRYGYKVDL